MSEPLRDPQQQLDWEAQQRPRAAVAAVLGGLLVFGGQIARQLALQDAPRARFLDGLESAAAPGDVGGRQSLQVATAQFLDDHVIGMIVPSVIEALGYFAVAYALTFLAAATRARRKEMIKLALYLPAIGGVLMGVSTILRAVGRVGDVNAFLDGPRTVAEAQDIGLGGVSLVAEVLLLPATLALAAALLLVSLNAMRAGLLTRFMGILGAIVGALQVIRIGPLPLVQTFWFLALAVLLAGRRQGGELPAWRTGREEPWPSQREVAEARQRQRQAAKPQAAEPQAAEPQAAEPQAAEPQGAEPAAATAAGAPQPSSGKRKRKRRT